MFLNFQNLQTLHHQSRISSRQHYKASELSQQVPIISAKTFFNLSLLPLGDKVLAHISRGGGAYTWLLPASFYGESEKAHVPVRVLGAGAEGRDEDRRRVMYDSPILQKLGRQRDSGDGWTANKIAH